MGKKGSNYLDVFVGGGTRTGERMERDREIRINSQIFGWGQNLNVIWQSLLYFWYFSRSFSSDWGGWGTRLEMTA